MNESRAATVRREVHDRLDYLDTLATTEITRLTAAWPTLLATHQPNKRGRCPECSRWRRPRRHPCPVQTTAHQHLITPDGPPADRTDRHATTTGRSTVAVLRAS